MRRVVSVWFPHWPTDRLRRHQEKCQARLSPEAAAGPLVTASHDGRRRLVAASNPAARALGLRPGMAVAQALAIVPGLVVLEAEPIADAEALQRLARWCHRITPLVAADMPDGLWLDISGCTHLWGNETLLLQAFLERLAREGLHARAAVADTPGAAHALARHGDAGASMAIPIIVPEGQQGAAIAPLPVASLRLALELSATLGRLGFEQVGSLARVPRALLARRFGPLPGLRLDQAHGRVHEVLTPLAPEHVLQRRVMFLEPLLTPEALAIAIAQLMQPLCDEMEQAGLGARQVDLLFERVDSHVVAVQIGTARPSRDTLHLARMLIERLDTVDPGLGIEAMHLVVSLAEPLRWEQQEGGVASQDIARLVDRLANRLGIDRLYRASPLASEMPERSVGRASADMVPTHKADDNKPVSPDLAVKTMPAAPPPPFLSIVSSQASLDQCPGLAERSAPSFMQKPAHLRLPARLRLVGSEPVKDDPAPLAWKRPWTFRHMQPRLPCLPLPWPGRLHVPSRLLDPPRRIEAIAALPDQPPIVFTWRRLCYRVCRSDGPERVHGEWWRSNTEYASIRDYFQVEDEIGQRFWLFRKGNGMDPSTGDLSWYLHGFF